MLRQYQRSPLTNCLRVCANLLPLSMLPRSMHYTSTYRKLNLSDAERCSAVSKTLCTLHSSCRSYTSWTLCHSLPSMVHLSCAASSSLYESRRHVFSDKVRVGMILCIDKRYFRVIGSSRSQKGQNAASYNLKLVEIGSGKKREVTAGQGHDFNDVKAERVRLLFSGFDDDDMACFVFPEHSHEAGKEVNLKGDSLPEIQQKFLCCGMPVDILHIIPDIDDFSSSSSSSSGGDAQDEKEIWAEVTIPTSYTYTVEKIVVKGLYKMASLVECDGVIGVNDTIQPGDKIKVVIKQDGTAAFGGRVNN